MLVYGMGEKPIVEIAQRLSSGASIYQLRDIPQIGYVDSNVEKYSKSKTPSTFTPTTIA
jgi:radical SAM superfamily enzyme YgiQ (UPF0313 family)